MASCSYTVADNGKTITLNGPSEFKAWLVNGGVEQLYPDGKYPWGSQKPEASKTSGSTIAQVTAMLPKRVGKMLEAGKLVVVQSVNDLPAHLRQAGNALFHTVFHGTPHNFDRFSLDKIGTGEGAQAFGFGLYFTDAKRIAEWYRDKLTDINKVFVDGKPADKKLYELTGGRITDAVKDFESTKNELLNLIEKRKNAKPPKWAFGKGREKDLELFRSKIENEIQDAEGWLSNLLILEGRLSVAKGKLYQVELAPTQDEYLDWDKPLSEQSETVKSILGLSQSSNAYNAYEAYRQSLIEKYGALGKASEEEKAEYKALLAAYKNTKVDDAISENLNANLYYERLSRKLGSDKAASDYLHSLGIRGIRYKADGGKSDASNYVVFSEEDISITAKYSQLSGIEGLYDPGSDTVYLVADMLNKGNLSAVLSHELLHRGLATDSKLKDAYDRFQSDMQRRFNNAAKGNGTQADKDAYARVMDAKTPEKDRIEEFGAYMVSAWQQNPDSVSGAIKKAIQDFIAAIRAFLIRNGLDRGFIKSLSAGDLMAMSKYGAKVGGSKMEQATNNPDIRFSIASKTQTLLKDKQSKFDTFIYQLQDRYIDLKRQMEKVVRNGGKITANPYQAEELYHQRAASRIKEFNEKELTPILQGLHDNGISMDDFQKFLHARHAESRNAVMAERNPSQDIIDAKLSDAEAALDALDGSDKKAMREAQKEVRKWRKAKPFKGTEEERLSLSGMSNQEARDFIAGLPTDKAKAMSALGDKIDRITNKTLDLLVNYGMETQETVDALKAQWEHYVPLHRDEAHPDNNGQPIGRGFSVRGSGLKTATGSNAEVTNILAHLAAQREQMIRRGEKNRVSNILAEFIKQHPDDEFATVDKVEMQDSLNDDGLVEGRMEPFFKRSMKDNVVMFRKDGKDHAITFNDRREDTQRLAMSLKNMDAGLDAVESIFAKGTRWMAAVNTQYNIVFGLFNLARDAQGMALNMSTTPLAGKQKQVFSHLWKSIKIIYGSERNLQNLDPELKRYYDAFNKAGGTTGYSQMFDDIRSRNKSLEAQLKDMGAGKGKKLLMAAKQWVSDYNSVMENATRLSVFIEAKNQGLNNDEAASIAKNITVNFNRKGSYTTKVGALYAFFNASMQGTARLAETMKGPKGKQILAGGVLAGALSTILGMMVMGDDEWEKIPEFVRERSLIIPTSKTGYITLPMPLGFHILPNIGRKVVEMVAGSSKVSPQQRLLELVAATAGAFNPLGGGDLVQAASFTVTDPIIDLARNKDWTGKPIYREDMNSLNPTPGFTRTKDTATSGAKMAAYAINKLTGGTEAKQGLWSPTPDQIDYLLGQILGGTGREVSKVWQTAESAITGEELPAYKRPLVGRLYGETKGNAAEKGAYYDNVKRLNGHEAEIKWLRENKQSNKVSEYLRDNPEAKLVLKANGIESSIRKLKSIHDKLEGAGANKQRLTAIDTQIVSQMKRLNDAVSNVNH